MKRAPSPSLVISLIALFVALGGTGYAAVKINGKSIKKGTISGTALKKNTLGGTQINESKLDKVPSAVSADNAGNAATLGGLSAASFAQGGGRSISKNVTVPTSQGQTLIEFPGIMRINASCSASNTLGIAFKPLAVGTKTVVTAGMTPDVVGIESVSSDPSSSTSYSSVSAQQMNITLWRPGTPWTAAVTISSAGCEANLLAVVHGE